MRLTSIKLSGFKSFVDPTIFQVPGQLVGVVGPNGCGKSNIIDAVRWVLGESKASELRGESMQDVIFNGSTDRKPAGRASVELIFDNGEGKASGQWGKYSEIAVKRILTRDGTSAYYINNQVVRRKDIQDIFLGTGLGPRAYAIIGQGMIARIIEARPEELRIFLEEAAGVSKYKERRRETENRLHGTRENLTRVEDILRELTSNLEKLEGQAAVARQFHAYQADQDEKQKMLWLLRKNEAKVEQVEYFQQVEQAQTELEAQMASLRHVEVELEQLRQAHYDGGDRVHQEQGILYKINSEVGSLEAQIKFVMESRHRLQIQLNSLTAQRDQWQHQCQQYQEEIVVHEENLKECTEQVEQARYSVEQQNEKIPQLEQEWRDAQGKSNDSKTAAMQMQQKIELVLTHQRHASSAISGLLSRRERLIQEKNGLVVPDDTHFSHLTEHLGEKQRLLEEVQNTLTTLQEKQLVVENEKRLAQERVGFESVSMAQLEARLNTLKQLQESVQAQDKVQPWLKKHGLNELPRLWKKIHIESGWEAALESVLREQISALEMSNLDWAKGFFSDTPPAKLTVFSVQNSSVQVSAADTEEKIGNSFKSLMSLLQFNDLSLQPLMEDWLHRIFVVDDVNAAFTQRTQLPVGACFITKQGHVISKTSVRFYAPDSEQDGLLARQQEIENLGKCIRAQQLLSEEAKSILVLAESSLSQLMQQLQEKRQYSVQLTQAVHTIQLELAKLFEIKERFAQRSTHIDRDLSEIAIQELEFLQNKNEAEQQFTQLDERLAELQENYEIHQVLYSEKEQQLSSARVYLRELERMLQDFVFLAQSQRNKIDELKRNIEMSKEQIAQLFVNMQQGQLDLESLDDQAAQTGLQALLDQRTHQERVLAMVREELDQVAQKLRKHDEQRLLCERTVQPQRDKIVALQLKEQAARLNQEQYAQQLLDAKADEIVLSEKLNTEIKSSYLQTEVVRLGQAIAALGSVNLAALDELTQAFERKNFLDAQSADLTEAMETLQNAIHKIDIETRSLLQDTFNQVNRHFNELFPILFGGGQAKLIMTGAEILDSGVQVMAQPPGKKNATIHLLSGGEKALTAIALVFSLFQLNPAPFCLLDEVDAPLDDANTDRFCNMVKRMSAHTQFLFISHNKIAMEMAHQLIGVTMQEQGVSRIVAVDIESVAHLVPEVHAA